MSTCLHTQQYRVFMAVTGALLAVLLAWAGQVKAEDASEMKRISGRIASVQSEGWFYDQDGTNTIVLRSSGKKYTAYTSESTIYSGSRIPRPGDRVVAEIVRFEEKWLVRRIISTGP